MEKFKFLDHPHDLRVKIFGQNEEELLKNAVLAMMTFLYPKQIDFHDHEIREKINIKENNFQSLFFDFLEKILELSDEKDICFNDLIFKKVGQNEIIAVARGRRVKAKNEIKKIFDHNLKINKEDAGLVAEIVFDI